MPTTLEALAVITVFVLPGYIAAMVTAKLSSPMVPSGMLLIIYTVALGLLNFLIAAVALKLICAHMLQLHAATLVEHLRSLCLLQTASAVAVALLLCFALPALLGIGLAAARNYDLFYRAIAFCHLASPRDPVILDSWDYLFDRTPDQPLLVELCLVDSSARYEGFLRHVTSHPFDRALVLDQVRVTESPGQWRNLGGDYLYIEGKRIQWINAYEPDDLQTAKPTGEPDDQTQNSRRGG